MRFIRGVRLVTVLGLMGVLGGAVRGVADPMEILLEPTTIRRHFLRMETNAWFGVDVSNKNDLGAVLSNGVLRLSVGDGAAVETPLPALANGEHHEARQLLDAGLRTGNYDVTAEVLAEGQPVAMLTTKIEIVERPLPKWMPVVMWGKAAMEQLKPLGFTHALFDWESAWGGVSPFAVWNKGEPVYDPNDPTLRQYQARVDEALGDRFHIAWYTSIGKNGGAPFNRIRADGKPVSPANVCALFPEVQQACYNYGVSVARAYSDYPAWDSALLHSETRDYTMPCFHEHDREAFKKFAGYDIPEQVARSGRSRGVFLNQLTNVPPSRIVPDDHPILTYYNWFWKVGDGWNHAHDEVRRGMRSTGRDIWCWYDPAHRPSISVWGSAGGLDVISEWAYTDGDPEATGLQADQLFAMQKGAANTNQKVMMQTQLFWYRGQATGKPKEGAEAPWEKEYPGAAFITISPDHLRIAFWSKMARPVQGIMYHGIESLVPGYTNHSYRYTCPETQTALRELLKNVVEPLGPALMQVPDAKTDVAILRSFTQQMFTGGRAWTQAPLRYAQLQPDVVFDETIVRDGLDGYRVLFMPHADVVTESVAKRVAAFQAKGGIVVGGSLAPGVKADMPMPGGGVDGLRAAVDPYVTRLSDSDNAQVLTRVRRYGSTDYLFAYNNNRQFGSYVGQHGKSKEDGVAVKATVKLNRKAGFVYDLLDRKPVPVTAADGWLPLAREFGAAEGRVWMVTERAVDAVTVAAPEAVKRGGAFKLEIAVVDDKGAALDAVVPVQVEIKDARGEVMEFSGYYGAKDGRLEIAYDLAANDAAGAWTVTATELASGRAGKGLVKVE